MAVQSENNLNGIILVNKPADWTSFDVVAKMRGILHIKKIGHAGTLDPLATGVLPVFVGKATRACDILPSRKKAYTAGFRLGLTTDTLDITGETLTECDKKINAEQIKACVVNFVGDIMQVPPMYSAVKVNGQKLCNLARQGIVVERKAREIHIDGIEILSFDEKSQSGEMYVACEKGTYIRSVIDDMGQALGCGAVMTSLVRDNSSGFLLENCHTLEEIAQLSELGKIQDILIGTADAFTGSYKDIVTLDKRLTGLYKNGVKLAPRQFGMKNSNDFAGKILLVFCEDKEFLGLARIDTEKEELRSIKNFY